MTRSRHCCAPTAIPRSIRLKTQVTAALAGGEAPRAPDNGDRLRARLHPDRLAAGAGVRHHIRPRSGFGSIRYERPGSQGQNEDRSDISGCH